MAPSSFETDAAWAPQDEAGLFNWAPRVGLRPGSDALLRYIAFAPILLPLRIPEMDLALKPRPRLRFDRTKKPADLTSCKTGPRPHPCKVLSRFRTKMFHVKHFWNYSKKHISGPKYGPCRIRPRRPRALPVPVRAQNHFGLKDGLKGRRRKRSPPKPIKLVDNSKLAQYCRCKFRRFKLFRLRCGASSQARSAGCSQRKENMDSKRWFTLPDDRQARRRS
jgi:hypothetical protein